MTDGFSGPPAPATVPRERSSVVRVVEAVLVGSGLLLVVIAALLAFLPVPPNGFGTCGPEFSSSSAVSVVRDPDQVLDWQPPRTDSHRALVIECTVDARLRVGTALVLLPGGVLVACCAGAVELVWRRGAATPVTPPAPYPYAW